MSSMLQVSYFLLCALIVAQWALLHELVREVAEIRRKVGRSGVEEQALSKTLGERVPSFSAPVLGSCDTLTDRNLLGKRTSLLFVDPVDATSDSGSRHLTSILHLLWHQFEKSLCVVCRGPRAVCERFCSYYGMNHEDGAVRVLLDEHGTLSQLLHVTSLPAAVVVSEDGSVSKFGTATRAEAA